MFDIFKIQMSPMDKTDMILLNTCINLHSQYSELPAVTRSGARLASQLGILLGLSWAVRVYMVLLLIGNTGLRRMVAGAPGGSGGGGGGGSGALLGADWTVGSPGASLCGLVWIGTVVGIGHVLVMAVSACLCLAALVH